jgi:hypothetical protein
MFKSSGGDRGPVPNTHIFHLSAAYSGGARDAADMPHNHTHIPHAAVIEPSSSSKYPQFCIKPQRQDCR